MKLKEINKGKSKSKSKQQRLMINNETKCKKFQVILDRFVRC
jgi:hypothetical protein